MHGWKVSQKTSYKPALNQLNAQAKITETWKALNLPNHPIILRKQSEVEGLDTRGKTVGKLIEIGKTPLTIKSFMEIVQDYGTISLTQSGMLKVYFI